MSYGQILDETQWSLLEIAEDGLYSYNSGAHAFTSVREREESHALREMWDDARESVTMTTSPLDDKLAIEAECASRVAFAQAVLVFGSDFRP